MEQWASNRDVRLSPVNARQRDLGAVFFEAAGWERPFWYGANERLLAEYGDRVMPRQAEWESRWWSPIVNAEHLAMRDRVGMVDLAAFAIFDVSGPGATYLQGLVVNQVDVPVGRVVYTPLLNDAGGIVADLTIMRLGHDLFRVVTGGGMGMRDKKWFVDHLPADGSAQLHDDLRVVHAGCLGSAGARPRRRGHERRRLQRGFPIRDVADHRHRRRPDARLADLVRRRARLGDLRADGRGRRLWDTLWEAGQAFGVVAVGIGVYATTGRLEKGYRAHGAELELDFDLVEAGMARPKVKEAEFVGKAAYLEQRSRPPAAILCTLTVDDPTSSSGVARYMLGKEPILTPTGARSSTARAAARMSPAPDPGRRSASTSSCRTCRPSRPSSGRGSRSSTSASGTR